MVQHPLKQPVQQTCTCGVFHVITVVAAMCAVAGCRPQTYRMRADKVAASIIEKYQRKALSRTELFTIQTPAQTLRRRLLGTQELPTATPASVGSDWLEPVEHWPEADMPARSADMSAIVAPWQSDEPLMLTLIESLQVGARNSREYQTQKEGVFQTALDLDLERDAFDNTFLGLLDSLLSTDQSGGGSVTGLEDTFEASATRRLKSGAVLGGRIILDLAKLLSGDRGSSLGIFADATVVIPLLRGAGRHSVTEPLTQAQRNVTYAIWTFERFKKTFAVQVAHEYLSVLQQDDQVDNAAGNYRRLIRSSRRARKLNEAGRLEKIQVDQALQDELSARDNWITAREQYKRSLDRFKVTLGLPTDARIELDPQELETLARTAREVLGQLQSPVLDTSSDLSPDAPIELAEPTRRGGGPLEIESSAAIHLALEHRLDLATSRGLVLDAQRRVVVAADALKAGVSITGTASAGERRGVGTADLRNADLRPEHGFYSGGLALDLPWERTAERNTYRNSYIDLEQSVRDLQDREDQVKLDVRDGLSDLLQGRESFIIQARAVELAHERVRSTKLFLDAGEAQIRDLLEANDDLVGAEDRLTAALVDYRVAELELQRDMGVLQVDHRGLWIEYDNHDKP